MVRPRSSPSKIPQQTSSKYATSLSKQWLQHKASRNELSSIKDRLEKAYESSSIQDALNAYEALIEDVKTHRTLLALKRAKLDRQLLRQLVKPEIYVAKSRAVSKRWDQVGRRLLSLERKKFQFEDQNRPTKLPEMGVGYALLKRYLYDPRGRRSHKKQAQFRDDLIAQYDLEAPGGLIWDIVLGKYVSPRTMKAAHIVPHAIPPEAVDYICGPGTGSRQFSWENGLLLNFNLEQHFDKGDVVIVPEPEANEGCATRFFIRVAIKSAENTVFEEGIETGRRLRDIDGKELEFRNDKRPMLRFWYWRYITSMLGNITNRRERAISKYADLKSARPWMTLKPYLRRGVLLTMAKEAGCMDDEVISSTLAQISDDDDTIVKKYSMDEILSHIVLAEPGEGGRAAQGLITESEAEDDAEEIEDEDLSVGERTSYVEEMDTESEADDEEGK